MVQGHGPLTAGHGAGQLAVVQGEACLPGEEFSHLPQLPGHVVHRLGGGLEGDVHVEVGHVIELGQVTEGQGVGVTGQGGGENEPGLGHQTHLGGPDEDLVIGAQAVGNPRVLRLVEEGLLGHGPGQVAGEPLAGVGVQALEVEHLTGGEEAHHHVGLGLGQAGDHGAVHQLEEHPVGLGAPFGGQLVFHPVGPETGGEQLPGPLGLFL